jgi:hypothetical protein
MADKKEVAHWRHIKKIARYTNGAIELRIDMERPEFTDHTLGYYRLNTLIVVDGRASMRLNTRALGSLWRFFREYDADISDALTEVRKTNGRINEGLPEGDAPDRFHDLTDTGSRNQGDARNGENNGGASEATTPPPLHPNRRTRRRSA